MGMYEQNFSNHNWFRENYPVGCRNQRNNLIDDRPPIVAGLRGMVCRVNMRQMIPIDENNKPCFLQQVFQHLNC